MPPIGPERGYLKEIYELIKENNRMLHRMRRNSIIGGILKFFWWILILFVLPAAAYYYYVEPQIKQLQNAYQGAQNSALKIEGLPDSIARQFQDLLAKFGFASSSKQ